MKNFRVSIVGDVPPDPVYTAGQVLDRIISSMDGHSFEFIWLNQSELPRHAQLPNNCRLIKTYEFHKKEFWLNLQYKLIKLQSISSLFRVPEKILNILYWGVASVFQGIKLGLLLRASPTKCVWFVLQGEKLVLCYAVASLISGKRYVLQQWDPLSWWMTNWRRPRKLYQIVRRFLNVLEKNDYLNIVPSDAWKDYLVSKNCKAIRLDNFFDNVSIYESKPIFLSDKNAYHAVFIGQAYAQDPLRKIINALILICRLHGKSLVLHYYGSDKFPLQDIECEVKVHGRLTRTDLINRIGKWDIALLPYPVSPEFSETANFSFPSKSRIYLAAGLPIVSWAPINSSPDEFYGRLYSKYYVNLLTSHMGHDFILAILSASIAERRARWVEAQELLNSQFSSSAELEPFKKILLEI